MYSKEKQKFCKQCLGTPILKEVEICRNCEIKNNYFDENGEVKMKTVKVKDLFDNQITNEGNENI